MTSNANPYRTILACHGHLTVRSTTRFMTRTTCRVVDVVKLRLFSSKHGRVFDRVYNGRSVYNPNHSAKLLYKSDSEASADLITFVDSERLHAAFDAP
jgi:hypothetical protein